MCGHFIAERPVTPGKSSGVVREYQKNELCAVWKSIEARLILMMSGILTWAARMWKV
jgi:hypothetical protein